MNVSIPREGGVIFRKPGERFEVEGRQFVAVAVDYSEASRCEHCAFDTYAMKRECLRHKCAQPDLIFLPLVEAVTFKLTGKLDASR